VATQDTLFNWGWSPLKMGLVVDTTLQVVPFQVSARLWGVSPVS
jgi:hypothetical protein